MTLKMDPAWCGFTQNVNQNTLTDVSEDITRDVLDIHSALGHMSYDKIKHLKLRTDVMLEYPCDVCNATKATRNVPRRKFTTPHRHFYELIHSDICEMPTVSIDGFKYFAIFIDDASRYSHVLLLKKKANIYQGFSDLFENGSIVISTIRTDQGAEYLSKTFQSLWISNDIRKEFASVATQEEKGAAERQNRTPLDKVRPMPRESGLSLTFWSFAVVQANLLCNKSPHSALENKSAFYMR